LLALLLLIFFLFFVLLLLSNLLLRRLRLILLLSPEAQAISQAHQLSEESFAARAQLGS